MCYGLLSIIGYEEQLQEMEEMHSVEKDSLETIIDSVTVRIDSLQNRYEIFDTKPDGEFIDIMNAIIIVESQGDPNAYHKGEDAVGLLQIRKCMVDDVNRILKRKGSIFKYTYLDRWDKQKSFEMFNIFCEYYNFDSAEEMARGWNGGPRGITKPSTEVYWSKVQNELSS